MKMSRVDRGAAVLLPVAIWICGFSVGCAGDDGDGTLPRDAGARDAGAGRDGGAAGDAGPAHDAGPTRDAGPRRDAGPTTCPDFTDYEGDASWTGALVLSDELPFCRFAVKNESLDEAYARRRRATLPAGTYGLPTQATDEPIFLPVCLPDGPALQAGTVSAMRQTRLDDGTERYHVEVTMPADDATRVQFVAGLSVVDATLTIDGPVSLYGLLSLTHCRGANCFVDADPYLPCALEPNMCDRLTFTEGDVAVDQFHWAGSVGAGFAATMRARGTLRGTAFDVTAYPQLTMAYGHHAFTRSLWLTFDAPIDGVCGLRFAEVGEYGQLDPVELLDCDGQVVGTSAITADSHTYRMPCD